MKLFPLILVACLSIGGILYTIESEGAFVGKLQSNISAVKDTKKVTFCIQKQKESGHICHENVLPKGYAFMGTDVPLRVIPTEYNDYTACLHIDDLGLKQCLDVYLQIEKTY